MRPEPARKSLRKRASFSKAIWRCPASRRGFPGPRHKAQISKKPPESGGFLQVPVARTRPKQAWSEPGLEPLGVAPAAVVPVRPVAEAVIAVVTTAIHAA